MTFRVIHGTNEYSSLTMMNIIYIWVVILNKVNQIDMYTIINMYTFSYLHVHIIQFFYQYIIDNIIHHVAFGISQGTILPMLV